ncbi:MAG TPA: alpha/beta hydrolase, partial [Gemmatimonadales bacterium]|nr:alpha/beta hydrolase [Gemmatimonadales bacterium]
GPGVAVPVVAPAPVSRLVLRVARVRGTELRFVERGSGTPVVLVHGSLETWESWLRQVDAFASTFRVIAYSRRYHPPNATRPDGQAYALALHADDLIALLEALGLERVHLVGSGYGAYVALLVTLRRPDLVRSLVLGEPPILPWLSRTPAGDSLRRTFEGGTVAPVRQALARGDSVEALRRFWDGVSGRPGRFDALPEPARAGLLRSALELRLEMSADPAVYMPPLSCTDVGRIRNAVLVVIGERSPRLYRLVTEELARCLPAAEMATVPGAGYSSHADNPAAYDAVVFRFLTRN